MWTLADALTEVGDMVTLFPPRYQSALSRRAYRVIPIQVIHLPLIRPLSYALSSFIHGLVRALRSRPDVVYYRWMDSPHPLLLAKLLRVPCVCEVNGEPVPDWLESHNWLTRRLKQWVAKQTLRHCERIVVLTEGLRSLLNERYQVSPDRIAVFPSGTDTQRFAHRDAVVSRLKLGLLPDQPYIGFVGTFYRYQGLACLLSTLALIKKACPAVRLLLVGDGEATDELRQQAKRLSLEHVITWTGRIPYWEVPVWIGAMSLCVAPFRADRGETSPVKIFDYLACQRPVVASAIPSVTSIFTTDSGVRFVPPDQPHLLAEAIIALLNDPHHCEAMGKQGRRFVEDHFSWRAIVGELRQWLDDDHHTVRTHAHSHVL
jgi:glycosyltransferase involved in cell wall biosynthesis